MSITSAAELVRLHEGCTLTAKPDAKGKWVIGIGHDIPDPKDDSLPTCTQKQADFWFINDLELAEIRAAFAVGLEWIDLDEVRRAALTDMAFELGGAGLSGFHAMLAAIQSRDWEEVKHQALSSEWAKQVPDRAATDAEMLLTGQWP